MKVPSRRELKLSLPGERRAEKGPAEFVVASEDAARHADASVRQIQAARGEEWYRDARNAADRAALTLCRLRRAKAGVGGFPSRGDEAVRDALRGADRESVIWLASRAISYMDESGFPEAAGPWFDDGPEPAG